ncbi:B3 domain-containing protein REM6-like [Rutidosis leptorrhynchoides]|uniref:B3 domain-containing protein REM6-like n=1 Tax=Rutidosis leptorrhynchoides TaxID=125765 RepID=UPI003A993B35
MADLSNHFFKFIKPNSKYNISIPRSFWEKLKDTRCKKAVLKRRCHEWPVDISEEGFFCDGWKEFVKDNEVQEFDFIVFKHQGNYVFDFGVFDQSMCERDYPTNSCDEMDVDEAVMDSDANESSKVLKKRKRNNNPSRSEDKFELNDDRSFTATMTSTCITRSRLHVPTNFARSNGLLTGIKRTQVVLRDEARRTLQASLKTYNSYLCLVGWREFKIKNDLRVGDECTFKLIKRAKMPVFSVVIKRVKKRKTISATKKETTTTSNINHRSFISTLTPSNLTMSCLYIPVNFSIQNGLKLGEVVLRDDKGRSWNAQLNKKGEKSFYVGRRGLKDLCYANGLTEGDTIKFELVENENDDPLVAKISPYDGNNKSLENHRHVKKVKTIPSTKKETTTTSNNNRRSFISTIKPYTLTTSGLYIPFEFSTQHGLPLGEVDLRDDNGRSWNTHLNESREKYFFVACTGLKDLCYANGLKEGDTIKFELVENENDKPLVAKISLYVNANSAPSEKEGHPYFIGEVKEYFMRMLPLSSSFAKKTGLIDKKELILKRVKDEKSWTVKLKISMKNNKSYICGPGWKDFCVANDLKGGDYFKLELVSNGEQPIANFYFLKIC